jgi:hypothetical protein
VFNTVRAVVKKYGLLNPIFNVCALTFLTMHGTGFVRLKVKEIVEK